MVQYYVLISDVHVQKKGFIVKAKIEIPIPLYE